MLLPHVCLCFCMPEVISSSFRSLRTGSQVFARLMLFLCVILHTMSSGKSLQLLCILPFGILCLSAINMMLVKVYIGGYGGLSVNGLCVFRVQSAFLELVNVRRFCCSL